MDGEERQHDPGGGRTIAGDLDGALDVALDMALAVALRAGAGAARLARATNADDSVARFVDRLLRRSHPVTP